MKNLFLTAALVLTIIANAGTITTTTVTNDVTYSYQEKEYKKITQAEIAQEVLNKAVEKYQGYALVEAFVASDGTDYKLVLTKNDKDVAVFYKSNGEFIKEEAA